MGAKEPSERGTDQKQRVLALFLHGNARLSAACALAVAFLVFLFHVPFSHSDYLLSDSADYLRAAQSPFLRTYLNTDSMSPIDLVALRRDTAFRSHPWDYLYFRGDNSALRHFHVPFSFYTMHAMSLVHWRGRSQRTLMSSVTAITCGVMVLGLIAFNVPPVLAVALALLAGLQSRYTDVSINPSPHGWYMLFAVLFLFTFALYLRNNQFRTLAAAAVLLAFAFATLEFSVELIASIPIALACLWMTERRSYGELKTLLLSLLKAAPLFCLVTFILWPGGWLRGGYLESYGVTGATVLLKNKAAFGDKVTAADLYTKLFRSHEALLVLLCISASLALYLLLRRRLAMVTIVFCSYAGIAFALGVADHFRLDTYISETLLFSLIASALVLTDGGKVFTTRGKHMVATGAVVLVAIICAQEWRARQPLEFYSSWLQPILQGVAQEVPEGETILVNDNWESYYAYLPRYTYEPTIDTHDITPRRTGSTKVIKYYLLDRAYPGVPKSRLIKSFPTFRVDQMISLYARD